MFSQRLPIAQTLLAAALVCGLALPATAAQRIQVQGEQGFHHAACLTADEAIRALERKNYREIRYYSQYDAPDRLLFEALRTNRDGSESKWLLNFDPCKRKVTSRYDRTGLPWA